MGWDVWKNKSMKNVSRVSINKKLNYYEIYIYFKHIKKKSKFCRRAVIIGGLTVVDIGKLELKLLY